MIREDWSGLGHSVCRFIDNYWLKDEGIIGV